MELRFDHNREGRIGVPEAVYCEGKTSKQVDRVVKELAIHGGRFFFTRLSEERFMDLSEEAQSHLVFDAESNTAVLGPMISRAPEALSVSIVAAGTSDIAVAKEAARTLDFLGLSSQLFADVGVAGPHRLDEVFGDITRAGVIIVIAGCDAALATVLSARVAVPCIGVPTSVGYGVAAGGRVALNAMLASCSAGLMVTNIDNGFGAACAAYKILRGYDRKNVGNKTT